MSKVKVNGIEYDENYLKELIEKENGIRMKDALYKKKCGNCNNDLHQPYVYCNFCGYKVKE